MNLVLLKIENIFIFILILILSLIASLRVGTFDTANYIEFYNLIDFSYSSSEVWQIFNMEYGFAIATIIFKKLNIFDIEFYFFIFTLIPLVLLVKTSDIFNVSKISSIIIFAGAYFPFLFLIQMRQGISLLIAYYAAAIFISAKRSHFFNGAILFLIAVSIHTTALFILLFSIIYVAINKININKVNLIIIFVSIIFISNMSLDYLTKIDVWKMDYYINNPDYNSSVDVLRFANIKFLALVIMGIVYYHENKVYKFLLLSLIVGLGLRMGFFNFEILAGRFASIFTMADIFFIPLLFTRIFKVKWVSIFLCLVYSSANAVYILFFSAPHIIELY